MPLNIDVKVEGPRTLTFSWNHPVGHGTYKPVAAYHLSCDPQPQGFPKVFDSELFTDEGVVSTESGFSPSTNYNCSVHASNRVGAGPAISVTVTTLDDGRVYLY